MSDILPDAGRPPLGPDSASATAFERARRVIPGGMARFTVARKPFPIYAASAEGPYLVDVDGRRYLDCANSAATMLHGHGHPETVRAVQAQAALGMCLSMASVPEVELAEELVRRSPSFEKVTFTTSGSEAVMLTMKLARAYTGRPVVVKCEGAYHGLSDFAEMSVDAPPREDWSAIGADPLSSNVPQQVRELVAVVPFNDIEQTLGVLVQHKDQVAGVILDALPPRTGLIPVDRDYVAALRAFCDRNGSILIYDQVITYRLGYGGVERELGVTADINALGKVIGGGLPIGAVAGSDAVMQLLSGETSKPRVYSGGTFAANPMSMVAGLAALRAYDEPAVDRLNAMGANLRGSIAERIRQEGLNGCITGHGSLWRVHAGIREVRSYRDAFVTPERQPYVAAFSAAMLDQGVYLPSGSGLGALSTPMTGEHLAFIEDAVVNALRSL